MNITRKKISEWLVDEQITVIDCNIDGFMDNLDRVIDEYEFWITIGYHCTVMRPKVLGQGDSVKDIAASKLHELINMATEEEKAKILNGLRYVPLKALAG